MNELETAYGDRVAFDSIDARSQLGEDAYDFYALRGHPVIAILDTEGELIVQIWGERPIQEIEGPLQAALDRYQAQGAPACRRQIAAALFTQSLN